MPILTDCRAKMKELIDGMTTDNYHSPQPEAANLRANIIDYAFQGSMIPEQRSIPTLSEWGMIICALLLGCSALWYMRRREIFSH